MVEDDALRAFIDAQPPGSWRDADLRLDADAGPRVQGRDERLRTRPQTATVANDGREVRDLRLPGAADRARVVRTPARDACLRASRVIPRTRRRADLRRVVAGRLALPSGEGRARSPGLPAGEPLGPLTRVVPGHRDHRPLHRVRLESVALRHRRGAEPDGALGARLTRSRSMAALPRSRRSKGRRRSRALTRRPPGADVLLVADID